MIHFSIKPLDESYRPRLESKINNLGKPKGSLGKLEKLALQLGMIQRSLTPKLCNPYNIIFCADHGIVEEGISQSPKDVTWQVVYNMLSGGAGVCYLSRQHGVKLLIVDSGVDHEFAPRPDLIDRKIGWGTRSYLYEAAMTWEELDIALEVGAEMVDRVHALGCNVISFGEMGITNTAASAVWMSLLAGIPLEQCVGRGSGLDDVGVRHKYDILSRAIANYSGDGRAEDIIRYFGGYEMVMAVGGMLRAAELGMVLLIDGFIMTACLLAASKLYPEVLAYAVYGHQGDEAGHARLLSHLGAMPLLHLDMRLGEGSGAICAYPIVQSAALMLSEMASFERANVTKYFD
ncbi:nicotinate-nucleotide--dimethylbenzimidazole phosphoribosyltransferase [Porphyromonas sp. COT-290 OH860]|uniref:nicotinate-nucleotide--dimethylbenzimidazole phosphoribosyltransferase n=1 Tax=Porphyromonas sp. COT-290 OH860 TaxID=1515615 RepID=UPI00052D089B|nr:nicotinate-nucleotide--dimethylbenzimidazole phosphoribosyltransferase [Porphyromonas sp. COT-290 OH860]KGN81853.1 nicotinate-nucleotide--dimethylbenzimidazole phosphoribosyltransferase [Porphyromonas sp. COT-290 OH860]